MGQEELGQKKRAKQVLITSLIFLAIGLAYAAFAKITGIMIPCLFRTITGFKCPGCGVSHMFLNLFSGKIHAAFHSNPFVFLLLPFLCAYILYRVIIYIKKPGNGYARWENIAAYIVLAMTLVFWVVRNI